MFTCPAIVGGQYAGLHSGYDRVLRSRASPVRSNRAALVLQTPVTMAAVPEFNEMGCLVGTAAQIAVYEPKKTIHAGLPTGTYWPVNPRSLPPFWTENTVMLSAR